MAKRAEPARDTESVRAGFVYVIYAGVVLLGVSAMAWSEWDLKHLASSFGHALVIAGILAFMVDGPAKRHILERMARGIYHFLIGHGLPPQVQSRIREVMQIGLVREDCELHYTLEPVNAERMRVRVTQRTHVRNYSGSPLAYRTQVAAEEFERPVFENVECYGETVQGAYSLSQSEMEIARDPEPRLGPGVIRAHGREIMIPTGDVEVIVVWRYALEMPIEYRDTSSWKYPTINVTVEATVPDDIGFEVPLADQTTGRTWSLKKLFMPGESVGVRWYRKAPQDSNATISSSVQT